MVIDRWNELFGFLTIIKYVYIYPGVDCIEISPFDFVEWRFRFLGGIYMFNDEIPISEKLSIGDVVYFYEYKNRDNIKEFKDLQKGVIERVISDQKNGKNRMAEIKVPKIVDRKISYDFVVGFIVYKKNEDFVVTKEGLKYVSFYIKNNKLNLCLKDIKNPNDIYSKLYVVFNIGKTFDIKFNIFDDVIFFGDEDINKLIKYIKIAKGELHKGYLKYELNCEEIIVYEFEFWKDERCYCSESNKIELFDYACRFFKNKNKTVFGYDYEKIFSLKHIGFEIIDY